MRNKSLVETAEEARQALRDLLHTLGIALHLAEIADWINAKLTKLTKEGRE